MSVPQDDAADAHGPRGALGSAFLPSHRRPWGPRLGCADSTLLPQTCFIPVVGVADRLGPTKTGKAPRP